MNNLRCLEYIYRLYWENLSSRKINQVEKIRDTNWTGYSLLLAIATYYVCSLGQVLPNNYHLDKIIFCFFWIVFSLLPYLYATSILSKNRTIMQSSHCFRVYLRYSFNSVFMLSLDHYDDLIAYLNMLSQTIPHVEETQTLKDCFKKMISERDNKNQLKLGYVDHQFVSYAEYAKHLADIRKKNAYSHKADLRTNKEILALIDEFKNNEIELFISKHFKRKEKSFRNYYLEHLNFDGKQDVGFFWFSLFLPLNPEWSLDSIKTILSSCRIKTGYKDYKKQGSILASSKSVPFSENDLVGYYNQRQKISKAFSQYSEQAFKKLFVKNHSKEELISSFNLIVKLDDLILPVVRSWFEISHFVDNFSKVYKMPEDYIILENIKDSDLEFSYVKSYAELGDMASCLQNCLIARHEKIITNLSSIIKVKKQGQIYAAVEVSNLRLVEMGGINHAEVTDKQRIIDLLIHHGIINRF